MNIKRLIYDVGIHIDSIKTRILMIFCGIGVRFCIVTPALSQTMTVFYFRGQRVIRGKDFLIVDDDLCIFSDSQRYD